MERMFLYKTPDIPEKILLNAVPEGLEIKDIAPCSDLEVTEYSEAPFFVSGWEFYKSNLNLFKKLNASEESIIIIYSQDERTEIKGSPFVYQFVRNDRTFTLARSIRNLLKSISRKIEYQKAKKLNEELLSIGLSLSAERDNDKLLDGILYKIRQITKADAGSLYLLEKISGTDEQNMLFKIAHNDSNPSDFSEFRMSLNTESIAGYVAVTSTVLNIPDAYSIPAHRPYSFNKSYDLATDYRTSSILTVPMLDHHENTIGVIQLINRKKYFNKKLSSPIDVINFVEPFDSEDEHIVLSLASQAAVALENNILYTEIETLFEGFVAASVKAIESRDPTTSGHSSRVSHYSVETAKAVNRQKKGVFADVQFTESQLKELRYAGLLHDFGKVGVREAVLVKSKKLYPGQLDLIKLRFAYIGKSIELEYYGKKNNIIRKTKLKELDDALKVIISAQEPSINKEDSAEKLLEYSKNTYTSPEGSVKYWITEEELELLSISTGSLTASERREIESHVEYSTDFLMNIPWTGSLQGLTEIARGHHERLDGSGYPDGLSAEKIPLQSRIMMVADIYDALTANDRPYKKAFETSIALKIIREEAEKGYIDSDVVDIFIQKKIYESGVDK